MGNQNFPEESLRSFVKRAIALTMSRIDAEIPQSGKFVSIAVSFQIPLTTNKGYIIIEPSLTGTAYQRRLKIAVCRIGYDKLYSHYLVHDTNDKIKEYLKTDGITDKLVQNYIFLSDKVDED